MCDRPLFGRAGQKTPEEPTLPAIVALGERRDLFEGRAVPTVKGRPAGPNLVGVAIRPYLHPIRSQIRLGFRHFRLTRLGLSGLRLGGLGLCGFGLYDRRLCDRGLCRFRFLGLRFLGLRLCDFGLRDRRLCDRRLCRFRLLGLKLLASTLNLVIDRKLNNSSII